MKVLVALVAVVLLGFGLQLGNPWGHPIGHGCFVVIPGGDRHGPPDRLICRSHHEQGA